MSISEVAGENIGPYLMPFHSLRVRHAWSLNLKTLCALRTNYYLKF